MGAELRVPAQPGIQLLPHEDTGQLGHQPHVLPQLLLKEVP